MNTPRCGVKDNVGPSDNAKRKKRYALQGSRWTKDTLDWRIRQDDHNQSQRQNEEKVPLLILKENLVLEEVIVQKNFGFLQDYPHWLKSTFFFETFSLLPAICWKNSPP